MRVTLTATALLELRGIRDYIRQFNPIAADRISDKLIAACDSLAYAPHRGRPIGANRRELLSVWPYIIRYSVGEDEVVILRIRHGKRRPD